MIVIEMEELMHQDQSAEVKLADSSQCAIRITEGSQRKHIFHPKPTTLLFSVLQIPSGK